jgi:hypothetical protein
MRVTIIRPDRSTMETHVSKICDDFVATTFGTFRHIDDEWVWIIDHRFKLDIDGQEMECSEA